MVIEYIFAIFVIIGMATVLGIIGFGLIKLSFWIDDKKNEKRRQKMVAKTKEDSHLLRIYNPLSEGYDYLKTVLESCEDNSQISRVRDWGANYFDRMEKFLVKRGYEKISVILYVGELRDRLYNNIIDYRWKICTTKVKSYE